MRRLLPLLFVLVAVACGGDDEETTTTEAGSAITGTVLLADLDSYPSPCSGEGGFDDLAGGANVVVKDGDGGIIGTGSLSPGTPIDPTPEDEYDFTYCEFEFDAPLAEEADFYTVEIAGRGGPTYSQAEMEAADWHVELELG